MMYFVVARTADGHEILPVMSASARHREDVMNFVHQRNAAFSQAHLAERMLGGVSVPDPLPGAAVLPVHIGRACVFVVLAVYLFSVLFTVLPV